MWIAFWWVPNILTAVTTAMCAIQGWRRRSLGLALLSVYFAWEVILTAIAGVQQQERDAKYIENFVSEQTGPNTWTAPVLQLNYDFSATFLQGLLLLAVILISRQMANRPEYDSSTSAKRRISNPAASAPATTP